MNITKHISTLLVLAGSIVLLAACGSDDPASDSSTGGGANAGMKHKPYWGVESGMSVASAPQWQSIPDQTLSSSMTVTIGLDPSFGSEDVSDADLVAAFCGNECIGTSDVQLTAAQPRCYLYVVPPTAASQFLTIAYYNARHQKVYTWLSTMPYVNNQIVGSISNPYVLWLSVENAGRMHSARVCFAVPDMKQMAWGADEVAVLVNGVCSKVVVQSDGVQGGNMFALNVPVDSVSDKITVCYYDSRTDKVYTSQEYQMSADWTCTIDNLQWK